MSVLIVVHLVVRSTLMLNKVMVIGDTHFSDSFRGTHKDYKASSLRLMNHIIDKIKLENPTIVIFAGDFIGVKEKNIRSRAFFLEVIRFLQKVNNLTTDGVFTLLGNHDIGGYSVTDVSLLIELGLFKHCKVIDLKSDSGNPILRFHMVDYGLENEKIDLLEGESNVVIGHNNFAFNHDSLYGGQAGIVLSNHGVWEGVDLVLSGHIHVPSHEIISGRIGDSVSNLFVLGSPSRVMERIKDCWYVIFESDGSDRVNYEAKPFDLWGIDEEFLPKEEVSLNEKELSLRDKNLRGIIQELNESRLLRGGLMEQIDRFPLVSKEVKERAKEILERVGQHNGN